MADDIAFLVVEKSQAEVRPAPADEAGIGTKGKLRGFLAERGFEITGVGERHGRETEHAESH